MTRRPIEWTRSAGTGTGVIGDRPHGAGRPEDGSAGCGLSRSLRRPVDRATLHQRADTG